MCFFSEGLLQLDEEYDAKFLLDNKLMIVHKDSSKTDQFRDGAWVMLTASGKPPVAMTSRYLDKTTLNYDSPLFCQLSKPNLVISLGLLFSFLAQPGRPLNVGYSWPGVFLLGASGRTGRFFTQLLFHNPCSGCK